MRNDNPHGTVGSSPHTRGARLAGAGVGRQRGIIPAYAGSTTPPGLITFRLSDHPRIRGEHLAWHRLGCAGDGSSPHTRGAQSSTTRRKTTCRIIPAYAGSTIRPAFSSRFRPDHPRIRGEHGPQKGATAVPEGSSPHTRGARPRLKLLLHHGRIIPAYAGSTSTTWPKSQSGKDHPRIRGEHYAVFLDRIPLAGSSPHTRGAPLRRHALAGPRRIIPAYAGSTSTTWPKSQSGKDHPRIRGEHPLDPPVLRLQPGSSPHTRGAPRAPLRRSRRCRIIPAYAGSTVLALILTRAAEDHPRIRGEHPIGAVRSSGS